MYSDYYTTQCNRHCIALWLRFILDHAMKEDIVCTLIMYLSDDVEEEQILNCQFAEHYYKEISHSIEEKKNYSGIKKIGCKAHIKVKVIS